MPPVRAGFTTGVAGDDAEPLGEGEEPPEGGAVPPVCCEVAAWAGPADTSPSTAHAATATLRVRIRLAPRLRLLVHRYQLLDGLHRLDPDELEASTCGARAPERCESLDARGVCAAARARASPS